MLKTSWRKSDTDAWLKGRSVRDDVGATLFLLSRGGVGAERVGVGVGARSFCPFLRL